MEKLGDGGGECMKSGDGRGMIGERCIICHEYKENGIHLYTSFICVECEREIIDTNTNEPKYQYFIEKLKKVKSTQIYS